MSKIFFFPLLLYYIQKTISPLKIKLQLNISLSKTINNIEISLLVDTTISPPNRTINNHVSVSVRVAINQYLRVFTRLNS